MKVLYGTTFVAVLASTALTRKTLWMSDMLADLMQLDFYNGNGDVKKEK